MVTGFVSSLKLPMSDTKSLFLDPLVAKPLSTPKDIVSIRIANMFTQFLITKLLSRTLPVQWLVLGSLMSVSRHTSEAGSA